MLDVDVVGALGAALEGNPSPHRIVDAFLRPFVVVAVGALARFMDGARDAESFMRTEEKLLHASAALSGEILAGTLAALHQDERWCQATDARSRASRPSPDVQCQRHAGMRETVVQFLGGVRARIDTPYHVIRPKVRVGRRRGVGRHGRPGAGKGRYPVLEALGIYDQVTPALASDVARQAVRCDSFDEAQQALAERGCTLDRKTVRRVALRVGEIALRQRRARIEAARRGEVFSDEFVGKRVVVGTDGGRLRTREGGKRGRRGKKGRRRFGTPWREPKLVTAYTIDDAGKQATDAVPLYDGTLGDADAAFAILVAELKLRGAARAKQITLTGDGAVWIWNRADELADALGLPREAIVKIVDFYHAVEHLTSVAEKRDVWTETQAKRWVRQQRRRLYDGKIDTVVDAIRPLCRGRNAKMIAVELRYFESRTAHMRYDSFRAKGLPCGSGATESAIRRVVNLRLKGPGIFWNSPNAERMLHLRCYLKAGRWDELMFRVIHRTPHGRPALLPVAQVRAA